MADALQLGTDRRDRCPIVQPQKRSAEQIGTAPRPVLERVLDEPGQGHHHPPLIPDPHDHVAAADLLDASPLAFDDHHVVQADRLRQCDLQAGDEVAEHRLGGDARHQPDQACRRQQRRADLLHHREGQQHQRRTEHDDAAHQHPTEHARLGLDAACLQVVGDIDGMAAQDRALARRHRAYQQPDEAGHQCNVQSVLQMAQQRILQRRRLQGGNQQQQRPRGGQRQPEYSTDTRTSAITPFQPVIDPQDQPCAYAAHH